MRYLDPEREQVVAAAERAWQDIVANYEAGRSAFIDARVRDLNLRRRLYDPHPRTATECGPGCPSEPHAHPVTMDDELNALTDDDGIPPF